MKLVVYLYYIARVKSGTSCAAPSLTFVFGVWKKDWISQPTNTKGERVHDITEGSNSGGLFCDGFKAIHGAGIQPLVG